MPLLTAPATVKVKVPLAVVVDEAKLACPLRFVTAVLVLLAKPDHAPVRVTFDTGLPLGSKTVTVEVAVVRPFRELS